jgi:carotenoid cleavage dioxygenase-like enzyme
MPSPTDSSNPPSHAVDLEVRGAIPQGLSGRLVGIGRDGTVHSVQVRGGRVSYHGRRFRTDAVVHHLVAFGDSILAFGDDSSAYELSMEIDMLRRVDLAGHGRTVAAYPEYDLATGELHLVARDTHGVQAHVVVSAGALTRRSRPVLDAPSRITGFALSCDYAVFVADGFVGIASRDGEARTSWVATGVAAPHLAQAHEAADAVVVLAVTPSLERWTLHPDSGTIECEVLDATSRRFAHLRVDCGAGAPRWVWTTGDETIGRHDLSDSRHVHHSVRPCVPGDFAVVPDAARPFDADGAWFVGFVHDTSGTTDLCVIDAAEITGPAIATIRIPRPIPHGLRCTWIPATHHSPNSPKEDRP